MNRFTVLSIASTLALLVPACSSTTSTTPGDGGGGTTNPGNDSGSVGNGDDSGAQQLDDGGGVTDLDSSTQLDGGSCAPNAPPTGDGGVPTYTAPALAQGVCNGTEISAFVTACGSSTGSGTACGTWANSNATSACGQCLASSGSTIAPLETLVLGNQEALMPSVGACILASVGTAGADCAAAVDEGDYCVTYACAKCTSATSQACATAASTGACSTYASALQTACSAHASAVQACQHGQGSDASFTASANAICGSGIADAGNQ